MGRGRTMVAEVAGQENYFFVGRDWNSGWVNTRSMAGGKKG